MNRAVLKRDQTEDDDINPIYNRNGILSPIIKYLKYHQVSYWSLWESFMIEEAGEIRLQIVVPKNIVKDSSKSI